MDFIFILVEPAVLENTTAAARAIKIMGVCQLRLVNTRIHLADEACWLTHASTEILDNAQVFSNLEERIADLDFTLETTAKNRSVKLDYYNPRESLELLVKKQDSIHKVNVIFESEDRRLTNQELQNYDIACMIPINTNYPSLNLAQSVMIMTYILSEFNATLNEIKNNPSNYAFLKSKTTNLLHSIEIKKGDNIYSHITERLATVPTADVNLFLWVFNKFDKNFF
jgi:tRNA/rRNA methyltransferase